MNFCETAPTCVTPGGAAGGSGGSGGNGGSSGSGSNGGSAGDSGSSGGSGGGSSQTLNAGTGGTRLTNPITGVDSLAGLIGRLIKGILGVVGSVALLMFVYGGIRWILSAGNPKDVTAAQHIIRNATVGMLLIFFSYSISSVILGFVTDIGGSSSESSGGTTGTTGGSGGLATCVEYAVTHGRIGRNEATDRTSGDWACRQTQPSERSDRTRCLVGGCPRDPAEVLCCAPLSNTAPVAPGDAGAPPTTPVAPVSGGGGGVPAGGGAGAGAGGVVRDTGPQGACVCGPSAGGGIISTFASADQIAQARNACQAPPANGRFDESSFTCTGRSTARECQTVETELNRLLTGLPVSARCAWTP